MNCDIDKLFGDKIREAIDSIYYYSTLMELDINSQVKRPNLERDHYQASLIINGKLQTEYD